MIDYEGIIVTSGQKLVADHINVWHVKRIIEKIEEEHCLERRLQKHFLETIHKPTQAFQMMEAGVVPPLRCPPSKADSDEERQL